MLSLNRNVIFLHIPKNGGTTFKFLISKYFKKDEIFDIVQVSPTETNLIDFINLDHNSKPMIKLITGHMMFGLHQYLSGDTDYITFLRDPIDRAISYYNHVLSVPRHRLHKKVISEGWTFEDFILKSNEADLFNLQVRLISGIHSKKEAMLEQALINIDNHFAFVGFQEHYDESLIIFKNHYKLKPFGYKKKNEGIKKITKTEVSDKTIQMIKELNKEDYALYSYCLLKFEEQLKSINFLTLELIRLACYNKIQNSTKYKILKNYFK